MRFTIVDYLNNVEGLTNYEKEDLLLKKRKILDKNISHATSWFKWQAWLKQKKAMWVWKVKSLDTENGYMYHKKVSFVENFNEFLIIIF